MRRPGLPWLLLLVLIPLASARTARGESPGERVIRLLDRSMTRAKDQHFIHELTTKEPGKDKRVLELDVRIKGTERRRVDFLGPGDVKGMKVLILSLNQIYVYLPAYRKVRRLAGHVRDQGFMGTTLSHDEMSIVTYGPVFKGKLLGETKTHWKVEGTRRPGKTFRHRKLVFSIRKDNHQPSEIRYFNDKGVHVKTETRTDYTCKGKVCQPKQLKVIDHTRNDAWSQFVCKKWEVNTGVGDRFFTVRALQRGR